MLRSLSILFFRREYWLFHRVYWDKGKEHRRPEALPRPPPKDFEMTIHVLENFEELGALRKKGFHGGVGQDTARQPQICDHIHGGTHESHPHQ